MDLWIRSQDKTTLIRSYEIYIAEHSNSYVIRAKRTSHILGAYKTIERAIDVLNEIQHLFIEKEPFKTEFTKDGLTIMNKQPSSVVYEMPEE